MDSSKRFAFVGSGPSSQPPEREPLEEAEHRLERLFGMGALQGRSFLDVGCGGGLLSLAATRLGARRVVSFDYDPDCVARARALCTEGYSGDDEGWVVLQGSVLDEAFVRSLGPFDVVLAWGVLHHTDSLWRALTHAMEAVLPEGRLAVAINNRVVGEVGTLSSESWRSIKRAYVEGSSPRQKLILGAFLAWRVARALGRLENPLRGATDDPRGRGAAWIHDARSWLAGFPYEFASVDEVTRFVTRAGFRTVQVLPAGDKSWGHNAFVFARERA